MGRPRTAKCGTRSGYYRHRKDNEKPCQACTTARHEYDKQRYAQNGLPSRLRAKAQNLALRELRDHHKDEYDELYRTIKARVFTEEGLDGG